MNCLHKYGHWRNERGAALLIAIFALLLISVVGIAMIVSTGTDSALTGNYRTSTSAYYAAQAGLEEARGRLLWKNQNYINITNSYSTLLNSSGLPTWGLTQVLYIVNPAGGEIVDPTSANPANYPDTEYAQEFSWGLSGSAVQEIPSESAVAGLPWPSYKWVRINPITEQSLNLDVNGDGVLDGSGVLFYDPAHVNSSNPTQPAPGLVVSAPSTPPTPPTPTSVQALEITSLSVLPSGSRRMLQYIVAPLVISPYNAGNTFPAALTLAGNGVTFTGPSPSTPDIFHVQGQDPCAGNSLVYSIGYTNSADGPGIAVAAAPASNFKGAPPGTPPPPSSPGIGNLNPNPATSLIRPNWLTPSGLDSVVQDITKSADVVFNGSINANTSLTPLGMSPNNLLTIVVNGNLDFNAWHNFGYGLLLVTGTLKYDPDAAWFGPVLVIGQGDFVSTQRGSGQINGAVFIAKTRDSLGNLLPTLGAASFSQTGSGTDAGGGIYYSSCAAQSPLGPSAQGPLTYKVLSFREIPLAN